MSQFLGFDLTNPFRSDKPKGFYDKVKRHTGCDYAMPVGTPISLPIQTKVELISKQPEMGLTLYLNDFNGNLIVLCHLSEITPKIEDINSPNSVFGKSGNSGKKTTAPHVHIEIIAPQPAVGLGMMTRSLQGFDGYNIDPERYLEEIYKNAGEPHWSQESMDWMLQHELIHFVRNPEEPVKWGELSVCFKRLAKKIIEWVS